MPRGELTRGSVVQAVAEFDDVGRAAFLQRYGFNGARDYFLLLDGKRYDSKAIVAVANKWSAGGGGQPLTALELSGGRRSASSAGSGSRHLKAGLAVLPTDLSRRGRFPLRRLN